MARVLFLTQVLPYPLDSGAKTRAYYVLRHLSQRHELTLASFVRADDRPEALEHLAQHCHAVHTAPLRRSLARNVRAVALALLRREPVVIVRDDAAEMRSLLDMLVHAGPYDVVHADQTSMAQYALYARDAAVAAGRGHPRAVLDVHNALYRVPEQLSIQASSWAQRVVLRREARALRDYERRTYAQFDHLVFVSDGDRRALDLESSDRSTVIPICVDGSAGLSVEPEPEPTLILHVGTMFWPPNAAGVLWFANQVLPIVLRQVPGARFAIMGKRPPREVLELATRQPGVEVLGYVEDPEPYLRRTAAFVVPLHAGAGMRVKILDAWAWGVPVVSTTLGAEGIALEHGVNGLLADSPETFADAVVRLLREPDLRARLRENGRRSVAEQYDWQRVYSAWDAIYDRL